jgi:bacterioferritin-associated ferredoxin
MATDTPLAEPMPDTDLDSDVCFCNHVTKRKLLNFIRQRKVKRVEDLANCLGAGTTCGLCKSRMREILEEHAKSSGSRSKPAE